MSTDAIVLLKEDHQEIREQFRRFSEAGPNAHVAKGKIVDKIIELLTVHTYIENEVMYPEVRRLLPDLEGDVLESYEEHHVADLLTAEIAATSPDAERFDAKVTVLIENVSHHMDEEEQDWFPKVREGLGRKDLKVWAARICRRSVLGWSSSRRPRRAARRSRARSRRSSTPSFPDASTNGGPGACRCSGFAPTRHPCRDKPESRGGSARIVAHLMAR